MSDGDHAGKNNNNDKNAVCQSFAQRNLADSNGYNKSNPNFRLILVA